MDYSKTLHLPQTEFPMRGNLPQKEPEFVELWQNRNLYKERIASIELGAFYYAKSSENLFKEENTVYVTVEDLAKNNVVRSNNGTVIDPRDEESSMNNIKVKITNENDEITAKVLS